MKQMQLVLSLLLLTLSLPTLAQSSVPSDIFAPIQQAVNAEAGDLIYVDFWASWCVPCRKSFPWMNEMHEKYQGDIHIVAVNVDTDRALADTFLKKVPAQFPIIYDPAGKLAEAFQVMGMPSSYMLDSKGQIISSHKGFFKSKTDTYEAALTDLIEKEKAK